MKFRLFALSLLLLSGTNWACSSSAEDSGKSTLTKVLEAPKKVSHAVHEFDSATKKISATMTKVAGKMEQYAPDSLRNRKPVDTASQPKQK